MQAPTVADMKRNIKLARHVVGTSDRAIVLKPIPLDELAVALFADGSWANEGDSTRGGHLVAFVSEQDLGRGVPSFDCLARGLAEQQDIEGVHLHLRQQDAVDRTRLGRCCIDSIRRERDEIRSDAEHPRGSDDVRFR